MTAASTLARDAWKQKGYYFVGDGRCRSCRAKIEWWETPNDKKLPLDPITLTVHFSTCGVASPAKRHRGTRPQQAEIKLTKPHILLGEAPKTRLQMLAELQELFNRSEGREE